MANLKEGTSIGGQLALHTGNIKMIPIESLNIETLTGDIIIEDSLTIGDGLNTTDKSLRFLRGAEGGTYTDWEILADGNLRFRRINNAQGDVWRDILTLQGDNLSYSTETGVSVLTMTSTNLDYKISGSSTFSVSPGSINSTVPIYSDSEFYAQSNKKVYHEGYKPTASDTGSLSTSGGTLSGNLTGTGGSFNELGVRNTSSSTGKGLSLYNGITSGKPTYGIMFAGTSTFGTHGSVSGDWATYLTMSDSTTRGWIFHRGSTNVASVSGHGIITSTGFNVGNGSLIQNHAYNTAEIKGYGSELMIGARGTAIHINYRTCNSGTANHTPTTWYWRAGTSTNWSDHQFGHVTSQRMLYANDSIQLGTDKLIYFDGGTTYYLREGTGSYGSVTAYGRKSGWSGYSIEGRTVFMHDGADASGIYNDVDNEWMFLAYRNGESRMYGNGVQRITANTTGAAIAGALVATGDVTAFSDIRLKTNIKPISTLSNVLKVRTVSYNRTDTDTPDKNCIGVIAQELEKVYPEFVHEYNTEDDIKSVDYAKLSTVLFPAIQEQQEIINKQQDEIDLLKAQLEEIKKMLNYDNTNRNSIIE